MRPATLALLTFGVLLGCADATRTLDPTSPETPAAPPPPPDCAWQPVHRVSAESDFATAPSPFIAQEHVWIHRPGPDGTEIWTVDPVTTEERRLPLAQDGLNDPRIIGASNAYVLATSPTDTWDRMSLWQLTLQPPHNLLALQVGRPSPPSSFVGYTGRFVTDDQVAFRERADGPLFRIRAGRLTQVSTDDTPVDWPDLDDDRMVFTEFDGQDWEVILLDGQGRRPVTDDDVDQQYPILTTDRIFTLKNRALEAMDLATGQWRTVHEGPCAPPTVYQNRAAVVCRPDAVDGRGPSSLGTALYLIEEETLTSIPLETQLAFRPRLNDRHLVWIGYVDEESICLGPSRIGQVYVKDLDRDAPPEVIGRVHVPCWCCSIPWPPAALELADDLVVFNYAVDEHMPEAGANPGSIGIVRRACRTSEVQ